MGGAVSSVHVVPRRVYFGIFAALLVLTFATVEVAFVDLGVVNTIVALLIACTKATLVILYFMHARWSERLIWIVIGIAILWVVLLLGITLSDYLSRGWLPFPGK